MIGVKVMLLSREALAGWRGAKATEKMGDPKNEGMSVDVLENKGQKIWILGSLKILLKTSCLSVASVEDIEKKSP